VHDPNDTIAAIATPEGGVRTILRIAGPDTPEVCRGLVRGAGCPQTRGVHQVDLVLDPDLVIGGRLYFFPSPRSYTGQTMAEIHVEAGRPVVDALVQRLLEAGARQAGPGEFTARAYLNGKMDLTQAEAVNEVVSSTNHTHCRDAERLLQGGLSRSVAAVRSQLVHAISLLEAGLDFPEEEGTQACVQQASQALKAVHAGLQGLLSDVAQAQTVTRMRSVGLAGEPNAGKSTLFNALVSQTRSLVSEIPGTTRDVLEAVLRTSGIARPASGQSLRDVTELRGLLTGSEIYRMVEVPLVPLYIGALYFFHPTLAWVALAGTVVLMILAVVNEVVSRPALKKMNTETLKGFSRVDDYVRSADAIQAMGMVPAVVRRWERQNQEKLRQLSVASGRAVTVSTLARFVSMALQVALYGVGAYLFLQHELLVGAMIAANMIMSRGLAPVEASISTWKTLVSGHAAFGRLSELLAQNLRQAGGLALPSPEGRLQVEKVTVISGSPTAGTPRVILQGVSFDLEPGKDQRLPRPPGGPPRGQLLGVLHHPRPAPGRTRRRRLPLPRP